MLCLLTVSLALSCAEDQTTSAGQTYGYVQFNLSKNITRIEMLDYLGRVCKVRVDLIAADGKNLSQALNVSAKDGASAELGMQSDKWMLLAGD